MREVQSILAIGPGQDSRDLFYTLKMAGAPSLWQALLDVQFRLSKFAELSYLYRNGTLARNQHFLEIGYGDGSFPGGLAPYFPEKNFVSAILPTHYILGEKQKTKPCLESIAEQVKRSGRSQFDCVILRVVLQRVSQLGLFLDSVKTYLSSGGVILVIDAYDRLLKWTPAIPTLDKLMKGLDEEQAKTGIGRTAAEKAYRRASLYGLRPRHSENLPVIGIGEAANHDFFVYFLLLSEVMVRAYGPILDQPALLSDLNTWIADENAHAQYGVQFVEMECL